MADLMQLAILNFSSPAVLFFVLGFVAALARSDLEIPQQVAKLLALYLLLSIGFRGGAEIAHFGFDPQMFATIAAGILLSFGTPFLAYGILRGTTKLRSVDAAAIAGHYGSISAVTFAAVTGALDQLGTSYAGYMVAVAAAMEAPAIFSALAIARRSSGIASHATTRQLMRDIALSSSIVVLLGALAIGMLTGNRGLGQIKPFIVDPFAGVLCLFLLDMGVVAARGLGEGRRYLTISVAAFGVLMPLLGAGLGAVAALAIGLPAGSAAVLITLAASASYIAAPAAMRLALPEANPSIALTLSFGVTFPFNLTIGIPAYIALAKVLAP